MRALILVAALAFATPVAAQNTYGGYGSTGGFGTGSNPDAHAVEGYTRQNGTYVAPHYETNPNGTQMDNYSTRGNMSPYTGAYGTRTPR